MDSVSQILLGAACTELVLGARIGRRASVIGAVLGTLPDLDVLVPYDDAIASFTYHRSWSHSLFVLTAASLPLAVLVRRLAGASLARPSSARSSAAPPPFGLWWLGVWLALFTHPLLDSFTTYGTQIWWPLPLPPVAIGSVFIIDPLYTLPLGVGLFLAWRRRDARGRRANRLGLLASTAYLGLTLLSQAHAAQVARDSLPSFRKAGGGVDSATPAVGTRGGVAHAGEPVAGGAVAEDDVRSGGAEPRLFVAPFPFALLWRVVTFDAGGEVYREGWYSLLDESRTVRFAGHDAGRAALEAVRDERYVARLDWFTDGFVRARERDGELVLTDLRIGAEGNYVFSFAVAERTGGGDGWRSIVARSLSPEIDVAGLGRVVRRAVDESVELRPAVDGPSGGAGEPSSDAPSRSPADPRSGSAADEEAERR